MTKQNVTKIPIESLSLMMLNVGFARHNGNWNWKNVNSPFTRIFFATEGEAVLHLPDQSLPIRPGYMYILPAYTTHSYECKGNFALYYLHLYETFKNEISLTDLYNIPTEVKAEELTDAIFKHMCNICSDAQLPGSDPKSYDSMQQTQNYMQRYSNMPLWQKMELRGSILMIASQFMRESTPKVWTKDERMNKVLSYIHKNIGQNIDINDLASVACLSKTYLIRLFKREFNTTPVQYINKKKMEQAQLLLYMTDQPVKEIAYELGFFDHSYFIRLFRKSIGTTPLEYRKNTQ